MTLKCNFCAVERPRELHVELLREGCERVWYVDLHLALEQKNGGGLIAKCGRLSAGLARAGFTVGLGGHAVGDMDLDLVVVRRWACTRRRVILVTGTRTSTIPRIDAVAYTIWLALDELELEVNEVALAEDRVLVAGTGLAVSTTVVAGVGRREQEAFAFSTTRTWRGNTCAARQVRRRCCAHLRETERRNDSELSGVQ